MKFLPKCRTKKLGVGKFLLIFELGRGRYLGCPKSGLENFCRYLIIVLLSPELLTQNQNTVDSEMFRRT